MLANAAQPQDGQRASVQLTSQGALPHAGIHVGHFGHQIAQTGQDHQQREFCRGHRGALGFIHHYTMCLAGLQVQVPSGFAGLRNHFQIRQPGQQGLVHHRALTDEHQRLHALQPAGQLLRITVVLVQDQHLMAFQLGKAVQRSHAVLEIIKNGNFHGEGLHSALMPASLESLLKRATSARTCCPKASGVGLAASSMPRSANLAISSGCV